MDPAVVLLNEDLVAPNREQYSIGEVAFFTRRCPGSEQVNEDSALVFPTVDGMVLAVADGAGGGLEGDKASRLAILAIQEKLKEIEAAPRTAILDGFDEANRRTLDLGTGAATTLAVVELQRGEGGVLLRCYHAGDSSVLVTGGGGKIKQSTIPHSPVGYGVEAGLIEPQDALHHTDLNIVSNLVGISDMRIEMGSPLELAARDTVVLGTDGLFDNLQLFEIVQLVRKGPLDKAAKALAQLATERMLAGTNESGEIPTNPSKPDDLTFVLYRQRG